MHLLKSFNDRRAAKKGAQAVEEWKQNKGRALHETGAFRSQDSNWDRPKHSSQAESQAANELNW